MKFTYYLEKIHGVATYPIVSLLLFVSFFGAMLYFVYKSDSKTMEHIAHLPLDEDESSNA